MRCVPTGRPERAVSSDTGRTAPLHRRLTNGRRHRRPPDSGPRPSRGLCPNQRARMGATVEGQARGGGRPRARISNNRSSSSLLASRAVAVSSASSASATLVRSMPSLRGKHSSVTGAGSIAPLGRACCAYRVTLRRARGRVVSGACAADISHAHRQHMNEPRVSLLLSRRPPLGIRQSPRLGRTINPPCADEGWSPASRFGRL
jgi:hypothetical protein